MSTAYRIIRILLPDVLSCNPTAPTVRVDSACTPSSGSAQFLRGRISRHARSIDDGISLWRVIDHPHLVKYSLGAPHQCLQLVGFALISNLYPEVYVQLPDLQAPSRMGFSA